MMVNIEYCCLSIVNDDGHVKFSNMQLQNNGDVKAILLMLNISTNSNRLCPVQLIMTVYKL